ncbi:MAG TPA: sugar phosphate isomerase/epimerase [Opitutaceae bacterium]|jgi:sugar phosphate isomerase/epimerase|nr:sugar phosphate isomerase/epimerase [Opitutaceae bacterium]
MKPILALSTSWCSQRYTDGYAMLRDMAELGFEHAELSHGIKITLVPGILQAVKEGVIRISSTHNFCPLPAGVLQAAPNLFQPSSRDPREHFQWVRHTKRSIDFAAQVSARLLVCHLGSVIFFWFNPGARIRRYVDQHRGFDPAADRKYQALLTKAKAKLRERMPAYWEETQKSIRGVMDYAAQRGILLALENREKFEELPRDEDYAEFVAGLPPTAGYWHDTGHAQIKQGEGLIDHRAHLERNAPRLIGFHLHDVNDEGDDHQPIGSGKIDFDMVSSFWKPEHTLVLELSPRVAKENVLLSRERLEALIQRRFGPAG